MNYELFKETTMLNRDGKRIGILVDEKPEYKESVKNLRKEFNEFTKKVCADICNTFGTPEQWSMSHRNGNHYKPYFWNQFKSNFMTEGISIWLKLDINRLGIIFGTTEKLEEYSSDVINQKIWDKYSSKMYEKFEKTKMDGFLNYNYIGNDENKDIEIFKQILKDMLDNYKDLIKSLKGKIIVDDYDKKGFRKYLNTVAKQENGEKYAKTTIDTYVNDLTTILHIFNQIDRYKDKTTNFKFINYIENKENNNIYLSQEFFIIMTKEDRNDSNLYQSSLTKIKKYMEYINFNKSNGIEKETAKCNNKTKNIILYGVPGVGKTYSHKKLIDLIESKKYNDNQIFESIESHDKNDSYDKAKKENRVKFITFHQSFGYEDFIEGFRPNEDGDIKLQKGVFRKLCKKAKEDVEKNYYLVIDEINRGNISKIFGELITLIEEDKRDTLQVTLPYSKEEFIIPSNLYIIGTMNSTDKSIALIDIALRRRFTFIHMTPNPELVIYPKAKALMIALNTELPDEYQLGHSYFMKIENKEDLAFTCKYKIKPLLEEYFYGDNEGLDEVLEIMSSYV